jgi:hypothetical protein
VEALISALSTSFELHDQGVPDAPALAAGIKAAGAQGKGTVGLIWGSPNEGGRRVAAAAAAAPAPGACKGACEGGGVPFPP